jgi:hypothetical protein
LQPERRRRQGEFIDRRAAAPVLRRAGDHDATGEFARAADLNIKPGMTSNEGKGDDWPKLRQRVVDANILVRAPKTVAGWNRMLASNTAHLARLLAAERYPGIEGGR